MKLEIDSENWLIVAALQKKQDKVLGLLYTLDDIIVHRLNEPM